MVTQEQTKRVHAKMLSFGHVFIGFVANGKDSNTARCPVCGALAIIATVSQKNFDTSEEFGTAIESPCDRSMVDKRLVFEPWNDEDTKARAERLASEDEQRRKERKPR